MINAKEDETLQGHRGSYKTTTLSVAISNIMVLRPNHRIMFMRKTDDDVKEVISQVKNILTNDKYQYIVRCIYGSEIILTRQSSVEISTNLTADVKGTSQLLGIGTGSSLTGKHFDDIFTDDIINLKDRTSRAERDRIKLIYQELQNVKNRGGRIFNTGTPWHKDDAFSIMPKAKRYSCYDTGLISDEKLQELRDSMTASLFAANYELRHIASDDVIFTTPQTGAAFDTIRDGTGHIDAAYGGEDFTAYTIMNRVGKTYYVYGRLWHRHVDDCLDMILDLHAKSGAGRILCEDNGDKGYLARDLRKQGARVSSYHENTNKFVKISTWLKKIWKRVVFVDGTDEEYINQICDYNENAEHDDAPDSAACLARVLYKREDSDENYIPLIGR